LFLFLGATLPAFAQEEHHEQEAKPAKQQEQAKPAKQEQAKPAKQEHQQAKGQQEQKQQQEQAKSSKQEEQKQVKGQQEQQQKQQQKQQEQAKSEKREQQPQQVRQEERANTGGQQHAQRTATEEKRQRDVPALRLSVRGEGRIPDERFRTNFGREHHFRIGRPTLVSGYSRFQYGGFWFGFVQPWPVAWYYTDDVYVDFIDGGYFLCNPYYPEERVSISVVI
jgi:flagellar motor protein MotB